MRGYATTPQRAQQRGNSADRQPRCIGRSTVLAWPVFSRGPQPLSTPTGHPWPQQLSTVVRAAVAAAEAPIHVAAGPDHPRAEEVLSSASSSMALESQQESRAVGCIVGAMCGNALGAPVQHERHWQVVRMFPDGLTEFWGLDLSEQPVALGHTTGEFQLLLAVAHSLASAQTCDVTQVARELSDRCDPSVRRFNPYSRWLLTQLRSCDPQLLSSVHFLASLPQQAAQQLARTPAHAATSFSDRSDREPWGPADNSAACSVAPLAIAYRKASWDVLEQAVQEMCLLSHSHPVGVDGARLMAAAVHWLLSQHAADVTASSNGSNGSRLAGAQALLQHLQAVAVTDDMRSKLSLLQQELFEVNEVTSWRTFFQGAQWHRLTRVHSRITYHDYATAGSEAMAVALWAFLTNWSRPRQAVCVAAALAGSVPVTTQLVGALAGALHGHTWIPASWWDGLENAADAQPHSDTPSHANQRVSEGSTSVAAGGPVAVAGVAAGPLWSGRDEVVALAKQLAGLRCDSVCLHQASSRNQ